MSDHQEAPLLSGIQTVQSIRDTGYKSTDYAIAELIDNAVDANATNVTVAIVEEPRKSGTRLTQRASEILVLDDGDGMNSKLANLALSFGGSGDYDNRENIGRFGMGLPQASVSQCRKTDVWSWQNCQIEQAHRTCLDLDIVEAGGPNSLSVPWPANPGDQTYEPIPAWVADIFRENHRSKVMAGQAVTSGTVVRWTNLDRLRWVKASSVLKHTEYLLGRIYRHFIAANTLRINILIIERSDDGQIEKTSSQVVRTNDPMYLSVPNTTILEFWETNKEPGDSKGKDDWLKIDDKPPFAKRQELEKEYSIPFGKGDSCSIVTVSYSEALTEARPGENAGNNTNLGQQARDNRGISIVRAGRELTLEQALVTEPTDRWWGVQINFSPELDEVFGVTNNKQEAPYFTTAMRYAIEYDLTKKEAEEEGLFSEDDPVSHLYEMAYNIRKKINQIKVSAKKKQSARKNNTEPSQSPLAQAATRANRQRSLENPTKGELEFRERKISDDEAASQIESELPRRHGLPLEHAKVVAAHYRQGVKVHFLESGQSQSPAFFWPDEVYDDEQIFINTEHPAYSRLIEPLRLSGSQIENLSELQAKKLLGTASDGLALLIQSYARLELEVENDPASANQYARVREEWGRRLREIVSEPSLAAIFSGVEDNND